MIYTSLKNNIYYDSNADVLNYKIVEDGGAVIYFGSSIKNPKSGLNRINVGEIIRDYLTNNLEEGWPALSGSSISQTEAYKKFSLISGELVMETYGVIFNWTDLFDGGDMVLSEPINGKMEPRMKFFWTAFLEEGKLLPINDEPFSLTISGETNFTYSAQTSVLSVVECSDWDGVEIQTDSDWFTVTKTSTGVSLTLTENELDSQRDGSLIFYYFGYIVKTIEIKQMYQDYLNMHFTVKATRNNTQPSSIGEYRPVLRLNLSNDYFGIIKYKINDGEWEDATIIGAGSNYQRVDIPEYMSYCGETKTVQISILYGVGKIRISTENADLNPPYSSGSDPYNDYEISGNILSLIYGDNFINHIYTGDSQRLGSDFIDIRRLFSAEKLALPFSTFASCYKSMFEGRIYLKKAPALPATTLSVSCYENMFNGCTSLVKVPNLPATTVKSECYKNMFNGCTSLVNAMTVLPATTLESQCYNGMFAGCTSLTKAPELPATTLGNGCYYGMFYGCTSLRTAPVLPAAVLKNTCYSTMFKNCTRLNYVKCLAENVNHTDSWLENVSQSGTFVKKRGVSWPSGKSGIPNGWTVQEADS